MVTGSDSSIARIQTVRNGRQEPLIPRTPLRSSALRADWHGMIFEEHRAEAEYVRPDVRSCSIVLHVFTGVPVRHEWRVDGRRLRFHSAEGSILILPNAFEGSVRCWRSRAETQWILEFDPTTLGQRLTDYLGGPGLELA